MIERVKSAMVGAGAGWVLWLMLALSVVSLAIMLERAWMFWSLRDDVETLMRDLGRLLRTGDLDGARRRLEASPSAEAAVVVAGIVEADLGAAAAEEAMAGASALQKLRLERRLAYLGTLGNNAPFIGLLGTVIGIVGAFEELGKANAPAGVPGAAGGAAMTASQLAPQAVMTNIAEALVATAVGLLVAIPAVAAFNWFQRIVKTTLANTDALSHVLLAHLKAVGGAGDRDIGAVVEGAASRPDRASKAPQGRGAPSGARPKTDVAGRSQDDPDDAITGINVTPLVDITLVLLIIFMVTAKIIVSQSVPLDLPKASQGVDLQVVFSVTMAADGTAQVDGKPIPNDDAVLALATAAAQKTPDLRAVIKADSAVPHGRVIHVLDLLKQAHVNKIAFGVSPVPPLVPVGAAPATP